MSTTANGPVDIAIDDNVQIVPPGILDRSMMSIARHPDSSIYLNTQSGPLYRSADNGLSWSALPVDLAEHPTSQVFHGTGVSQSGRLYVSHSPTGSEMFNLYVSYSDDGGERWISSSTDFSRFPPGVPDMRFHEDGNRTFVQLQDGTLLFTTTIVPHGDYPERYPAPSGSLYGGRPGDLFSDVVFRSTDNGATWGDPSLVYPSLNPHESNLAVDPGDPHRVLIMTRCQRGLYEEEDPDEFMARTGNPLPSIKQGCLLESRDGGRTFLQKGWTNYYGHRGSVCCASGDVVIVTHSNALNDSSVVARLSLNGGRTWVGEGDDTSGDLLTSRKYELVPDPPGHSFTTPTIELSPGRFMTAYGWYPSENEPLRVNGLFWHLEPVG